MKLIQVVPIAAVCLMVVAMWPCDNAGATSIELSGTSPSFSPDTEWRLYVGYLHDGDILGWAWSSYDSLSFWVERVYEGTTTKITGLSNVDAHWTTDPGSYYLCWYNNNWLFSATVTYSVLTWEPELTITTPVHGAYLSSATVSVQGTYDGMATGVLVGLNLMHLSKAMVSGNNWGIDDVSLSEGENSIIVQSYYWLDYYGYENHTLTTKVEVICDTVSPSVTITAPSDEGLVRDNYVDISWQCSDECGIAKTEMKIDGWGWSQVQGTSYSDLRLSTGHHTIQIRVTDHAGNQATDSTTFSVDARALSFDGPYYGAPLVGIVLGVVIAAVALVMLLRRRRGGPAAVAVPKEEIAPGPV